MTKARQRERKLRAKQLTYFVEIPRGVVLKKFVALVDGKPVAVKAISGNKIILVEAPLKGSQVEIRSIHD